MKMLRYLKSCLLTVVLLIAVTAVTALPVGAVPCSQPLFDCEGCPQSAALEEAARLLAQLQQQMIDRLFCVPALCGKTIPAKAPAATAAPTATAVTTTTAAPTATTTTTTTAAPTATTTTTTTAAPTATTTTTTTAATTATTTAATATAPTAAADPLDWLRQWLATRETTRRETVTTSSQPAAPAKTGEVSAYERQVVELVNGIRTSYGLSPLQLNEQLCGVARMKSQDMHDKGYFSHTSPTYGSPFDMMKQFGITYRAAGENIAMGYPTPEAVVEGWMNSEGHRANILNANFKEIGVGYVSSGRYWTQMFIG